MDSAISGFHKLPLDERLRIVKDFAKLSDGEVAALRKGELDEAAAECMIENVVGAIRLPVGIATNFRINGKDYLIPMAVEESSVVAAASHAAKLCRSAGGFTAETDEPVMIGQVQLVGADFGKAKTAIEQNEDRIAEVINRRDSAVVQSGGGFRGLEVRKAGENTVVHLLIDVRDAMGANFVNSACEKAAPLLGQIGGGKANLRVLSNLAVYRKARATAVWRTADLEESFTGGKFSGMEIVENIISAWRFAQSDIYRRATHNKGIMNGVGAVAIATGNDWRALEAGAHTYSALTGEPLTKYRVVDEGIEGTIELPLAVGTVGGATKINPVAQVCLRITGVENAKELACIAASVGLANNFAALRALATEGIQRGHMELHATNIAVMAGANGEIVDKVAAQLIAENNISASRAKEILDLQFISPALPGTRR